MLRIAICDDEFDICKKLKKIIIDHCMERNIEAEVLVFTKGEKLEQELASKRKLDVLFLDVDLNTTNGIDIGKKIRLLVKNERIKIIFISWNDSHAMSLFEVRPFDFIVKPLEEKKITLVLNKLIEIINDRDERYHVNISGKCYKILLGDIIYFESDNRKIKVVTVNGEMEYYGKLKDVLTKIRSDAFLLIHKSFIINYNHVLILEYDKVTMINNTTIPISQPKRKTIRSYHLENMER